MLPNPPLGKVEPNCKFFGFTFPPLRKVELNCNLFWFYLSTFKKGGAKQQSFGLTFFKKVNF
jgi:hypothetical protein